jgi:hypothetical protein
MGERFLPLNDFADEHRVLSVLAEGTWLYREIAKIATVTG